MPLTCEAVIFDLDGVLVDSDAVIERRWRQWADHHGIPFEEVEAVYHGRPMVEVIEEVAPHLDPEAETNQVGAHMANDFEGLTAFEGAAALLEGLPNDRWAIATSGRHRTATARLTQTNLPRPNTLVTADDVQNGKPAPDPYQLAAEGLGRSPDQCLVLEDSPAGVESARRAGAHVIGITTTNSPEALSAADALVGTISDVHIEPTESGALGVQWTEGAQPAA